MSLSRSYLTSSKKAKEIFTAVQAAQAPPKFTTRFLEGLGFKSPPDRLIIGVLKSLGFLTPNGEPTKRYFEFLDQTQSPRILAEAIREAYADLFQVNLKANELSQAELKNKLKTLTQGQLSDSVLDKMAGTFKTLCQLADFAAPVKRTAEDKKEKEEPEKPGAKKPERDTGATPPGPGLQLSGLVYNIQLVLPESRDTAVFDALFKSLKEHLLR